MSSKGKRVSNSFTDLVAGVSLAGMLTGGSTLSSYGTVAYSNNYSLMTLNRIILTYLYTGNGIFQTAIQLPIQDALSKRVEIESSEMSAEDIEDLLDWMEQPFNNSTDSFTPWTVLENTYTWVRLYGGGGVLINDGKDPETPFDPSNLALGPLELYDIDRWQMDYGSYFHNMDDLFDDWTDREFFYVHGVKIHKSRILRSRGKRAPYYVRRQLRGWGMSEGERMIRDLNLYLKTQDVLYEVLDESKLDIYKMKGLAQKLLTKGGTAAVQDRVLKANQLKNYVNALILDENDEYEQKSLTFTGLAEVMRENRMGVAAALRMPMTKLFGLSASGFNTGESDLENYNAFVESDIRTPMRPMIKKVLEIGCSKLFGYVPSFRIKYPSLRVLSAMDEETVKTSQLNRALSLYDRGLIDSYEVAQMGNKDGWINIETNAEKGLLDPQPIPPNGGEFIEQVSAPGTSTETTPFSEEKKI
jgi:phage-related protein (TIGR01555 family)